MLPENWQMEMCAAEGRGFRNLFPFLMPYNRGEFWGLRSDIMCGSRSRRNNPYLYSRGYGNKRLSLFLCYEQQYLDMDCVFKGRLVVASGDGLCLVINKPMVYIQNCAPPFDIGEYPVEFYKKGHKRRLFKFVLPVKYIAVGVVRTSAEVHAYTIEFFKRLMDTQHKLKGHFANV